MCIAAPPTRWVADEMERIYPSAVFAGIVPDQRHLDQGGYHVCLNHLWSHGNADDYSNTRRLDESPPVSVDGRKYSAAIDVSLGAADMKRLHARVRRVWADKTDPRRRWVNAINCWDGAGDAVRYDFPANTAGYATPDHKSHTHGDVPRLYVDMAADPDRCWLAARAFVSVVAGESRAQWESGQGTQPTTTSTGDDDMPTAKEVVDELLSRDMTYTGGPAGLTVRNLLRNLHQQGVTGFQDWQQTRLLTQAATRPQVEAAPVDPAALKAALLDPQVLAAIAAAVNSDASGRLAQ